MRRRVSKKQIKTLAALVVGLIILLAQRNGWIDTSSQVLEKNQPGLFRVTNFDDGDTIEVDMNGAREKIRFIGVDTPETHDPRKAVQCFGQVAAAYTKQLIGQNSVRLESDPLSTNRDRYNRLLRYVYLPDGTLVNQKIIEQGYGFALTGFPFTKSDSFLAAQAEARQQNRGLWHDCTPTENQYGGYTSNDSN